MATLWAVTSYFNPVNYERRRRAFRTFRDALGVPLIVVEVGYGGGYDLCSGDAEVVIQVPSQDVMWQKERLLNIAVGSLPAECEYIAWLDCDILFACHDWPGRATQLLRSYPIVQLFQCVQYLGDAWQAGDSLTAAVIKTRSSIVSGVAPEKPIETCLVHPSPQQRPGTFANGMAWAARRELIDRHHFYDACIIGGGDRAMTCAAYGCFEHLLQWHQLNQKQWRHYLDWAGPFFDSCRSRLAALDGDIYHQWHGDAANRGLLNRHEGLHRFGFDPYRDICLDAKGCWKWSSDKPEMHEYVANYFASRREDG